MLITLLVILLLVALLGGGFGLGRGWGMYGWSPLGLLILIVLILALTGNLHAEPLTGAVGFAALGLAPGNAPLQDEAADESGILPAQDPTHYALRWWVMLAGWLLGIFAGAIGVMEKIGWASLGIHDITANWLLVIAGIAVLISGALATFPTVPDRLRLHAENNLHEQRRVLGRIQGT